jgi:hypothetical protein
MRARLVVMASALICLAGFAAALFLSYRAGCAADLKGGTWGDPIRALELENWSVTCAFLGWLAGLPGAVMQRIKVRQRIGIAVLLMLAPTLWIASFWLEGIGSTACIP